MESTEQFFEAIRGGDRAAVEALLEQEPALIEARSGNGLSPLMTALYYQQPDLAALILARSSHLSLFEAAASGQARRVQELLDQDPAQVNAFAGDGFQALGLAAFFGRREVVDLLLARGAEVNTPSQNAQQVMPLHSAVAGQNMEIVQALLARGADANARQPGGFTPLHGAAQNGSVEMVKLLLSYGADPQARTADGKTAADFAQGETAAEILNQLRGAPAR